MLGGIIFKDIMNINSNKMAKMKNFDSLVHGDDDIEPKISAAALKGLATGEGERKDEICLTNFAPNVFAEAFLFAIVIATQCCSSVMKKIKSFVTQKNEDNMILATIGNSASNENLSSSNLMDKLSSTQQCSYTKEILMNFVTNTKAFFKSFNMGKGESIKRPQNLNQHKNQNQDNGKCILFMTIIIILSGNFEYASANMMNHEPMFISRSESFKFIAGETINLPCEAANTENYALAWKRGIAILTAGSVKISPDPRIRLVNGFNLQIQNCAPQDGGDYTCQIATLEPREITHTVEILVPPRIHHISSGGHLQVKKGSSVRIECAASGNPMPNITWSRKNNHLPNGDDKVHSATLAIENVDRHKGGIYICTAHNGVGQAATSQVAIHVLFSPEITVERSVVFSGEGHEATLVCIVHGETQPEVIWFKDTMQIDTTERHIMENRGSRHTLIIRKVHPQDFGNYSCVAENQLGKTRKTLTLSGKPNVAVFNSAPISQYKDRYNISWSVDSHSPVEEYKLSFRRLPQGHELDNGIDSPSSSSTGSHNYGGGSSGINMGYGNGAYGSHRIGNGYGGISGYGMIGVQWGRNDWRDVVLPAIPLSHHYTQSMSYMIRGLDPDQHYEATVQSRNRYGWSELTHNFVFSTSSNDNEMRDLSVTLYGGAGALKPAMGIFIFGLAAILLKNFF